MSTAALVFLLIIFSGNMVFYAYKMAEGERDKRPYEIASPVSWRIARAVTLVLSFWLLGETLNALGLL